VCHRCSSCTMTQTTHPRSSKFWQTRSMLGGRAGLAEKGWEWDWDYPSITIISLPRRPGFRHSQQKQSKAKQSKAQHSGGSGYCTPTLDATQCLTTALPTRATFSPNLLQLVDFRRRIFIVSLLVSLLVSTVVDALSPHSAHLASRSLFPTEKAATWTHTPL